MWIVGLKNAVHDTPVDLRTHSVERNIKFFPNHTSGSITRNKKLGPDSLFFPRALISESRLNRMAVTSLFRLKTEVGNDSLPLD